MENELDELQPGDLIDNLTNAAGPLVGELLPALVTLVIAIVVLYVVWRLVRRRRGRLPLVEPDLGIDVASLGTWGPPPGAPVLEHYNVPVRLAAIVVAPAGRARRLPPPEQLGGVFEAIVPGLADVVATHDTLVRCWPEQLSSTGFAHSFFRHVKLPGDGGKGTQWSSAAGMAKIRGQPVMAGLLMRSERPNSLGQFIVEHETKWLDILRVKPPQSSSG
jgi:hypothetical protein